MRLLPCLSFGIALLGCASEAPIEASADPEERDEPNEDEESDDDDAPEDDGPATPEEGVDAGVPEPAEPAPANLGGNCSALRREALGSVDTVSTATVALVEESGGVRTLYVDASAGGFQNAANYPYVYVNLETATGLAIDDFAADESLDWDLAFKRFTIRTNGGDSGPGEGGAAPYDAAFQSFSLSEIDSSDLAVDDFIDDQTCDTFVGDEGVGGIWTAFSGWYAYEEGTMVLRPVPAVYVVRAADGVTHYELELLDYYGTPEGGQGQVSGRFLLRYARLE
jgi:hypothetical protein